MNTNINPQDINPERIAKLLTHATEQLDNDTVAALRQARNVALEKQTINEPVFVLATGYRAHWHWLTPHSAHQWAATAILLVTILVGGVSYWHHAHENEISHLDVAILTDDLPMEVFVN